VQWSRVVDHACIRKARALIAAGAHCFPAGVCSCGICVASLDCTDDFLSVKNRNNIFDRKKFQAMCTDGVLNAYITAHFRSEMLTQKRNYSKFK
jgi:hypothetical protein